MHSSPNNLLSVRQNPESVTKAKDCSWDIPRVGLKPRLWPSLTAHHQELSDTSIRIILDLFSSRSQSINDGISKNEFSVFYLGFDDALKMLLWLGSACFLAKLDQTRVFLIYPPVPRTGPCSATSRTISFRGYSCRSSPFIFNTFVKSLHWILGIAFLLHYLDDFLILIARHGEHEKLL